MDNEQIIRNAYEIEVKDSEGWLAAFTSDGTLTDESIGVTYRGRSLAHSCGELRLGVLRHAPRPQRH